VGLPLTFNGAETGVTAEMVRAAFEASYKARFSRILDGAPIKIVSLRATAIGRRPHFDLGALAPGADSSLDKARRESRTVWFGGAWVETAIWSRLDLPVGAVVAGPAILEQPDATTVVEHGQSARVDRLGNLLIETSAL
jgi:N-methylhydantoinase A